MKKFLFIVALLLGTAYAWAQTGTPQNKAAISTEINTNLPNNTSGQITPQGVRQLTQDMNASYRQYIAVNSQLGASVYTVQTTDAGALIQFSNSSGVAVTLPAPILPGFGIGFDVYFMNLGVGPVTIFPQAGLVGGQSSWALAQNQGVHFVSDGTNYQVVNSATIGIPASGSATTSIVQGLLTSNFGVSGSAVTTTGTMTTNSRTLTLAAAQDFANGQGILVAKAGSFATVTTPIGLTVTPTNAGSTSVSYQIAACDHNGGVSTPTVATTITNSNAALGGAAFNTLTWNEPNNDCFLIYRGSTYLATTSANTFVDEFAGATPYATPFWAAAAVPNRSQPEWLVTAIASGGGTTSLTLAASATRGVASQLVQHDDTASFNAWMTSVAALCQNGYAAPNSTIRISGLSGVNIGCSNTTIDGQGAQVLAAGAAANNVNEAIFSTPGPTLSSTVTGYCMQGSAEGTFSSSIFSGSFPQRVEFNSLSPGDSNYDYVVTAVDSNGSASDLQDACPVSFYDDVETVLIGGTTFTSGDTLRIGMTSTSFTPNTLTATYAVVTGDTAQSSVDGLAIAVNNLTPQVPNFGGINAWHLGNGASSDNTVYIGWPNHDISNVTFTLAHTGTGSETLTKSLITTWTTVNTIAYSNDNLTLKNWNMDGSSFAGGSLIFGCAPLFLAGLSNSLVQDVNLLNWGACMGLYLANGYHNIVRDLRTLHSGAPGWNAVRFQNQTRLTLNNLRDESSPSFGVGLSSVSWVQGENLHVTGSIGRCFKIDGGARGSWHALYTAQCFDTGISLTWGTWYQAIYDGSGGGQICGEANGNSQGFWTSNDFNRYNTVFGGSFFGACPATFLLSSSQDIAIFGTDTNNAFYGVLSGTIVDSGHSVNK